MSATGECCGLISGHLGSVIPSYVYTYERLTTLHVHCPPTGVDESELVPLEFIMVRDCRCRTTDENKDKTCLLYTADAGDAIDVVEFVGTRMPLITPMFISMND